MVCLDIKYFSGSILYEILLQPCNYYWRTLLLCFMTQCMFVEVTALRAQISEMRHYSMSQERLIRERQRDEYNELVQNLFQACYTLKQRLDEYR